MSSFPLNSSAAAAIVARRQEDWPELDISILEDKRGTVPPFPLDLLAQPWRDWVSDTASSAGAPADYVVQAVLAALAGLCGAGVAVRVVGDACAGVTAESHRAALDVLALYGPLVRVVRSADLS
jgi:hypothetical protein